MSKKHFLFTEGRWLGAGEVTFSISPDTLYFRCSWDVTEKDDTGEFLCLQRVEIVGGDRMQNIFTVSYQENDTFAIELENELLGVFSGTGVLEEALVAWEFRDPGKLEGYEVYELAKEDEYTMRAEYISVDGARTIIRGKIWNNQQQDE